MQNKYASSRSLQIFAHASYQSTCAFRLTIYISDIRNEFRVGRSTGDSERNFTLTAAHSRNLGYASYRSPLRFASILKFSARRMAEFSAEWLLITFLTADASAG